MKRTHVMLLFAGVLIAAAAVARRHAALPGFATADACLDTYLDARRSGNVDLCLACLAEPLRSELRHRVPDLDALAVALRQEAAGIKSRVYIHEADETGPVKHVSVDEVRTTGTRRVEFRLEQTPQGWLITAIAPGREVAPAVPYGTPAGEDK